MGAVLHGLGFEADGRAALDADAGMLSRTGATPEDSDGLINMPLTVKEIQAVAFFKEIAAGELSDQPPLQRRRGCESRGQGIRGRRPQKCGRVLDGRPVPGRWTRSWLS